jgi:hypothetical protein
LGEKGTKFDTHFFENKSPNGEISPKKTIFVILKTWPNFPKQKQTSRIYTFEKKFQFFK